ncbi:endonuclease domain-containing protein [Arthrobacter agilis]|uniref:endonuclease domain-containing protein n=1 Tax=Arthrobacter agilis TaxID=37921 RepID=UPI00278B51CA|nr:DUF559 domain-containing protein [Arthrobacter agilis]MDQ0734034.1 very-short-patch-repair endonuclease [Arthrobacter agilis]
MTLEAVLSSVGGVAPTHVLRARGVSQWHIDRGVDDGRALRVRRGVVALPDAAPALVTAVNEHARLTCISAATYYGLWRVHGPAQVHLSRLERTAGDCVNHRTRSVAVHANLPLVGLVDVLVHALQCRPEEESVPMVECALRRGDATSGFLLQRLQGRRNGRARAALAMVECTADSVIEVVARLLLRGAGLDVQPQVPIPGVGQVDFLVEGFLIVEIDGAAFHSDRQAYRRDRLRNNTAVLAGYLVLRFTYEDVMFHPEELLATVLTALGGRPIR